MPRLKGTYNIPDWALCPLEYGINSDEYGLTDEDIAQIKDIQENVIGGGYYMDIHWEDYNEFNTHPQFGLPAKTYEVDFYID